MTILKALPKGELHKINIDNQIKVSNNIKSIWKNTDRGQKQKRVKQYEIKNTPKKIGTIF